MMSMFEAKKIIGNQNSSAVINMWFALELHWWNNTDEEWERLQACNIILKVPSNKRIRKV